MTKKDYLRTKTDPEERVMTWKALGANTINDSTKIYVANQIYYVNVPLSELNGALLYCNQDYTGNIDWTSAKLFDKYYGEITFGYNVASPYFSIILTPSEFSEVPINTEAFINAYKSFVPYGDNYQKFLQDKVTIKEEDYQRIISVLGSPFIREDELEYTRDEICDLAIRPALEEYFHWIPAIKNSSIEIGQGNAGNTTYREVFKVDKDGNFVLDGNGEKISLGWAAVTSNVTGDGTSEIDLPEDTYGVVGLSLQQLGGAMNGNMLSPLFYGMEQALYSGMNYTGLSGSYTGSKAPKTQTNSVANIISSRANAQALINYGRRVHYEGPYDRVDKNGKKTGERYIRVWSNTSGTLNVWWARRTLDFNDVEYQHRNRVFTYSQACVKELFAYLRRQSKSDIPGLIDYKEWLSEAKETKENITKEYKAIVKASGIIRGSL